MVRLWLEVAQSSCGYPVLGNIQGQVGQALQQPALVPMEGME